MRKYIAEIDAENKVLRVLVVEAENPEDFGVKTFGGVWKETSKTGEFRKNFAGIGHTYDSELDAFIRPKPFDSWVLDEETAQWEAPVEYPSDGKDYTWDEETVSWVEIPQDEE